MFIRGLYVIINRLSQNSETLIQLCEQAILGGADVIQYRDKNVVSQETIHVAKELSALCHRFEVPFVINDHIHLATQVNADAIHIGQKDISVKKARQIIGDNTLIGVSASNIKEAQQAAMEGANYLGCGHIYPTTTKKKTTPLIFKFNLELFLLEN